ncbi:hypothetical protein JTB14_034130 [Gonioctena quinquepunctata]|nr:hypothetical protein JTB14_034130 [Gonioctena quinquepunctata]
MTASCEILQDKRKSTKLTITTANNEGMSTDILGYIKLPLSIGSQKRKKLDAKATPSIFVGYSLESKAYRLYDPQQNIVYISRSVQFVENKKGSTLLEKKKEDAVEEKDLFWFPEQEPTEQTRKDFEKADLEERNEVDISEPENGLSS